MRLIGNTMLSQFKALMDLSCKLCEGYLTAEFGKDLHVVIVLTEALKQFSIVKGAGRVNSIKLKSSLGTKKHATCSV